MQDKPTNELDELLEHTKPEQLRAYLSENKKYLADEKKGFYYFMKNTLDAKRMKLKDVYARAGFDEVRGGRLLRMESHTKERDMILRLCLGGKLRLSEVNRALKLYGFSELYAKEARDACIIVAINNKIYDLYRIDELLEEQGLPKLLQEK